MNTTKYWGSLVAATLGLVVVVSSLMWFDTNKSPSPIPGQTKESDSGAGSMPAPVTPPHPSQDIQFTDDRTIVARSIAIVNTNKNFILPSVPDVQFAVNRIVKASGGSPVLELVPCGHLPYAPEGFIFVKNLESAATPSGLCFNAGTLVGYAKASLIVVDLAMVNSGSTNTRGSFIQVLYDQNQNGKQVTLLAQTDPPWPSYGVTPLSSQRNLLVFEVPDGVSEVRVVYGDYSDYGSPVQHGSEPLLSRSAGGFVVNFTTGTISDIPG